jgi:hypothetical protein
MLAYLLAVVKVTADNVACATIRRRGRAAFGVFVPHVTLGALSYILENKRTACHLLKALLCYLPRNLPDRLQLLSRHPS